MKRQRLGSADKVIKNYDSVETSTVLVIDDLPDVPISNAEISVIEIYLGAFIDEILGAVQICSQSQRDQNE